jgi:hypothetical protein
MVKKILYLDHLPRWEEGSRYRGKIKWQDCIGKKVEFEYDGVNGEVEIIDYKYPNLRFIYEGKPYEIPAYSFLKLSSFSVLLGKYKTDYTYKINEKVKTKTGEILTLEQIRVEDKRGYKFKCLIDGYVGEIVESRLEKGSGCPVCSGHNVMKGVNDISTSHSEIVKYFVDEKEAYSVSHGSEKEINCKCIECGFQRKIMVKDLVRNGFPCTQCSDGISYPTKFIFNLLNQLEVKYSTEYSTEWSLGKRYDFYIQDLNVIIEVHGEQHYINSFKGIGGRTLEEEQENDRLKEELAKENGIKEYIIIDCRYSELDWIKNKILKSKLSELFYLNKIEWLKCHKFACNTRVKEASDIWNKGINNASEISKIMNLHNGTVRRYLKMGRKLGWNDYDEHEALIKGGLSQQKKIICLNTMEIFDSSKGIEEKYNVNRAQVNQVCNHPNKSKYIKINNKPFVFMFYEKYLEDDINVENIIREAIYTLEKKRQKQVVCLNTGEIFTTLKKASEKYNIAYPSIINCCNGLQSHAGIHIETKEKLIWMYLRDCEKLTQEEIDVILSKHVDRQIIQLTKESEYIQEFPSINVASEILKINKEYISENARGKRKTTNGFIFIYKDNYTNNIITPENYKYNSKAKCVLKLDKSGNVLEEFDSVTNAMNNTGVKHISAVCRGERKSAGGFTWMYKDEHLTLIK